MCDPGHFGVHVFSEVPAVGIIFAVKIRSYQLIYRLLRIECQCMPVEGYRCLLPIHVYPLVERPLAEGILPKGATGRPPEPGYAVVEPNLEHFFGEIGEQFPRLSVGRCYFFFSGESASICSSSATIRLRTASVNFSGGTFE